MEIPFADAGNEAVYGPLTKEQSEKVARFSESEVGGDNKGLMDTVIASLTSLFSMVNWHMALISAGNILQGTNTVTGIHRFGMPDVKQRGNETVLGTIIGFSNGDIVPGFNLMDKLPQVTQLANALLDEMKNPNIEGIPIHADAETEQASATVSKMLLINQDNANKEYGVDNTVPELRTWTLKGYLMSGGAIAGQLSSRLIIKPDLLLQRQVLQAYRDSRRPVMFKTHDNRFFRVLITNFETAYDVRALNALAVNITLTEFKALEVTSTVGSLEQLQKTGEWEEEKI